MKEGPDRQGSSLTAFIVSTVFLPAITTSDWLSPGIWERKEGEGVEGHRTATDRPLTTLSPPSATASSNWASLSCKEWGREEGRRGGG